MRRHDFERKVVKYPKSLVSLHSHAHIHIHTQKYSVTISFYIIRIYIIRVCQARVGLLVCRIKHFLYCLHLCPQHIMAVNLISFVRRAFNLFKQNLHATNNILLQFWNSDSFNFECDFLLVTLWNREEIVEKIATEI